ncbi:MAG: AAA family ATPase [Ilumatobacteraceae bacterium]
MTAFSDVEWEFRARRYRQLCAQVEDQLSAAMTETARTRDAGRPGVEQIIQKFRAGGSVADLRSELDVWSRGARHWGFAGPNGTMFLNQLVNDSDASTIDGFLRRAINPPTDDAAAAAMMAELEAHVEQLRAKGSAAALGRVAPLLSWFWWVADAARWPVQWTSVVNFCNRNGFKIEGATAWETYSLYCEHVAHFGPFREVEEVADIIESSGEYGLDITTCDRLAVVGLTSTPAAGVQAFEQCQRTLELLREMAKPLGDAGAIALRSVFHSDIEFRQPSMWWDSKNNSLRRNLYLSWTPERGVPSPSLMLLADGEQVQIGLYGSSMRSGNKGLSRRTFDVLENAAPAGTAWMVFAGHKLEAGRTLSELPATAILGKRFSIDDFTTHAEVIQHVTAVARTLLPAFEKVWAAETSQDEVPTRVRPATESGDGSLRSLAEQFRATLDPSDDTDVKAKRAQVEWERILSPGNLAAVPLSELRRIYSGSTYGNPGPQSILNTTLGDEEPTIVDRFRVAIEFLLWDESVPVAERIDRVMDENQLGLRGFKEGAIMKFLAVAKPKEFLAVYPFTGRMGKAAMLQTLGLEVPLLSASVGTRQVASNDALRAAVAPLFPDDGWVQSRFLYWLMARTDESGLTVDDLPQETDEDRLGAAAADLLLPRGFLDEIQGLLEAHRQVVFFGPPGTGKTYVALRLAEALAPAEEQRMLVQFHPSTSYEDFFEGYRPLATGDDQMVYKLVSGPLRIMAERASADLAQRPHILIIDEINRANLAKVLGELLFLLEYRDREINPLYRPSETFSLPKNLWIIGTMNTADRSIATVDAALRRRFHFVPFVPDDQKDNPISGLLARWLTEKNEPSWVAGLVDGVNQRLRREMGGNHLLLGPSYFMQPGLNRDSLALIWKYRIEPLIDDLFFGDERAKAFSFEAIWNEFGERAAETE